MQLTPEVRAQLAEQKKQCIFCKIISKEMDSKIVFEDDFSLAVLDIYPALKGHTVLMLKEHYPIMPYIPADEFDHVFGIIPQLASAIQKGVVARGCNIFIANGGAAGQQSPHFLIHLLPREPADGFFNFMFRRGNSLPLDQQKMLATNLPIMMKNHFGRNPANWHVGKGDVPHYLADVYKNVIYEDEKVLCVLPEDSAVPGHIIIYSKTAETDITTLSQIDSSHLFFTASFAATAVFEGLGAQATNIILKSGQTDDNPTGNLSVHILPRSQGDSLQKIMWNPKQPSYDLGKVANQIKEKTWQVKYSSKDKFEPLIVKPATISAHKPSSAEEIMNAIEQMSK